MNKILVSAEEKLGHPKDQKRMKVEGTWWAHLKQEMARGHTKKKHTKKNMRDMDRSTNRPYEIESTIYIYG